MEIFTSSLPTREFVEVGIVEAAPTSGYSAAGDFDVIRQLRTEGGARGCDGLIVNGESKSANGQNVQGNISIREQTAFRATCIVYK